MSPPVTLAIETSCDETSAAILRGERELLGHVILSQDAHRVFGGVVPEIASRAHLRTLDAAVAGAAREAGVELDAIDRVAVTAGPGLIGALLVGVSWGKSFAWSRGIPVIGVHHMEAHLFATWLEDPAAAPPFVGLLVSGGHTLLLHVPAWGEYRLLGGTRDDAAGEAFDKAAKLLGLPYPGGPSIERAAREGDPGRHPLPRPLLARNQQPGEAGYYDFSFSGLKTALRNLAGALEPARREGEVPHLAASFQAAVVEVLSVKTLRAVQQVGCGRVVLGGGVANSRALRDELGARLEALGGRLHAPSPRLSTDNAAMVAAAGAYRMERGERDGWELSARADLPFPGLVRAA